MNTVLVCGGREYNDEIKIFAALDALHVRSPVDLLISGGAHGADSIAERWARANEVAMHVEPAKWTRYGRSAGPKRNDLMLRILASSPGLRVCVAFPGGRGTQNMVDLCRGNPDIHLMEIGRGE